MLILRVVLSVAVTLPLQPEPQTASAAAKADVARLMEAAERLTDVWPKQAPPAIAEVAVVARHGRSVTPQLTALLSDDPNVALDPRRWHVQQQASLALSRIYSGPEQCGRVYCDGDPNGWNANVKSGWLRAIESDARLRALSTTELIEQFRVDSLRQLDIGTALAERGDRRAIRELEALLTDDDRHVRGNAAFVLARLGDPRGFKTIEQVLADRSPKRAINPAWFGGNPTLQGQIGSDRFYAAILLGRLKDPRGVPLLVPLLNDPDIAFQIPWSLGRIGDPRAIPPLIQQLQQGDASVRVLAIAALEQLNAVDVLPRLRELLLDDRPSNFGEMTTVAAAARHAIVVLSTR